MVQFATIEETRSWLRAGRHNGKSVGFVPTMGALHQGHLDLVRRAKRENDLSVCSIFVNPIQFNNKEDLEKYPRNPGEDLRMLADSGCDMVFTPTVEEMYPSPVTEKYDFGYLGSIMEGKYRPGHFNGVAIVVKKLFDIAEPDRAYFGEKDFQQLRIIQALVRMESIPVEIVPCPTVREDDGLAMSSRNMRLSRDQRAVASQIYLTLLQARDLVAKVPVKALINLSVKRLENSGFRVDYFEIADADTLKPLDEWGDSQSVIACVAAYLGNVRLIDNMILFPIFAG